MSLELVFTACPACGLDYMCSYEQFRRPRQDLIECPERDKHTDEQEKKAELALTQYGHIIEQKTSAGAATILLNTVSAAVLVRTIVNATLSGESSMELITPAGDKVPLDIVIADDLETMTERVWDIAEALYDDEGGE